MDDPLVVYRDAAGQPHALTDRCPHRNAPLSLGRVGEDGALECGYHGWRFAGDGRCVAVPGLGGGCEAAGAPSRAVASFPVRERDGFVWVWGQPDSDGTPDREPFLLPSISGAGTGRVVFPAVLDCTMHAALENSLDVPHTAFLHGGIFRGRTPNEIVAVRTEVPDGVEAQYHGEPVAFGPIRIPARRALTFQHWDRFFLPGIAQIEYRVDGWLRIVNTILHLPESAFRTRAWFVLQYWTRLPSPVVRTVVQARGRQILRQDASMLNATAQNVQRFGGERYTSTELDVLGNAIWRLLRQAERAEGGGGGVDGVAEPEADAEPELVSDGQPVTLRI